MNRSLIEALENRQLLSVSPLAKPAPFPQVAPDYVGQAVLSTGATIPVSVDLTHQSGGPVSGVVNLNHSILEQKASGNVSRHGVLHVSAHAPKFSGKVVATVSPSGLSGTISVTSAKSHYTATFSASPVP